MRKRKKNLKAVKKNKTGKVNSPEVEPITAAGGIVYRLNSDKNLEILMIYRNGAWDLPKGKHEEGETIEMCAAREVAEEVGSSIPALIKKVGETYHEYPEQGKWMGKTTHWYSMIFTRNENLVPQTEEGIENIKWMPFDKAINVAGYKNLKEILQKFIL